MAFTKIDHVGILVDDLEAGARVYTEGWGLAVNEHRSPLPQGRPGTFDNVTSVEIPIGEMYIELSKPNDPSTPAGVAAARRSGMYYLSFASDNIAGDVAALQAKGVKIEGDWDGSGPVMLDPETTQGVRYQITPEDYYFVHPYYKGDGTFQGMAHIGLAARDVEEVRGFLHGVMGLHEDTSRENSQTPPRPERDPNRAASDPVRLIEFPIGGTVIEISVPTTDDSGTARLVQQRATLGAVFHHICPFAMDVHKSVDMGIAAGLQQLGTIPPREETTRVVAWFHPRSCNGVLTEIWNRLPGGQHAEHTHGTHPGPEHD